MVTFVRFFPKAKARYDYGLSIFILTYSLVSVSGYRDSQVSRREQERISTIVIGSVTAILVCVCVCPVWIGEELHNDVAKDMDKLAHFLQGYVKEYFKASQSDKSSLDGYKTILSSEKSRESMVNLAKWEPCHFRFKFRYPWELYLDVGAKIRECAYKMHTLRTHLQSEIQSPLEIRRKIQDSGVTICTECSKALKELSSATKKMKHSKSASPHITNSKAAAENLKTLLKKSNTWRKEEEDNMFEILPAASVASLVLQIPDCVEEIAEAVHELAVKAGFKRVENITESPEPSKLNSAGSIKTVEEPQCAITM